MRTGKPDGNHVLLECPLLQGEREWMRNALSDRGVSLRRDELLARPEARTIVAEFMVCTGLLGQFLTVDSMVLGAEKGKEEG